MLPLEPAPDWMAPATCAGMATWLWFPERGERPKVALKVSHSCVVQQECAAYGLEERVGLWGGMSERERRKVRRRRNRERDARA